MNISVFDGSSYFKGLLLLIRKDKKVTSDEKQILSRVGSNFGFEKNFIENAINEILENRHISTSPPVFSDREIAKKFLKDGLILAASDREIHPKEEEWLTSVAVENNIDIHWYNAEKENILHNMDNPNRLEADSIRVSYRLN